MTDLMASPRAGGEVPNIGYKPSSLHSASELLRRFPARPIAESWTATRPPRGAVLQRLSSPPFAPSTRHAQQVHYHGLRAVLDWLAEFPGDTWQDRLLASAATSEDNVDWKYTAARWWSSRTAESVSDKRSTNLTRPD